MQHSVMWRLSLLGGSVSVAFGSACAQSHERIASSPRPSLTKVSYTEAGDRVLDEEDLDKLSWRSIGPANMGGRVAALAMAPSDWKTWYIGYATGGLWKTTNAGTTFSPIFDEYETSSIGSVGVADAPSKWPGWADEDDPPSIDEREESATPTDLR